MNSGGTQTFHSVHSSHDADADADAFSTSSGSRLPEFSLPLPLADSGVLDKFLDLPRPQFSYL